MPIRRTFCLGAAATALGVTLGAPRIARAADQVTFRLNWILYGFHTPFYLGLQRGYYKDEGIDLSIGEGQGSVRAVQTVGAGGDDFGLSDGGSIVAGASKGAPVKAVVAITSSSPYAVSVRADTGITTLKGLEGATIASAPGEAGLQLFPGLLKRNGVDPDKVKVLRIEGAGKMVAVAEKRADGLMTGLDNQALTLPRQGIKLVNFGYAANNFNTMGLAVHTSTETLKARPEVVRRFVAATIRSFQAGIKEPEAAIEAGIKVKPDMANDRDLAMEQLKVGIGLMRSKATEGMPLGRFAEQDWADTLAAMKEYQALETTMTAGDFYTNDYQPKA